MKTLSFGIILSLMTLSVVGDEPVWPVDFWGQVANHLQEVAPTGSQVASQSCTTAFCSNDSVSMSSPTFGSEIEPFSSFFYSCASATLEMFDTLPVGFLLLVR